ncbi:helix-turn-helix domain-containing protein [Sporosarcina limicola]|uniref:Transcriptional regulator with XRE-family HTH domain n=1 Tax=Sporosarcina limicola TaxID=34101 RepID=A0A927MI96_9BACL|nr:helix-turn-helix transcriptional regulator [Sporosarcina limicola]MBE1555155.1 transcriptional regulator with XRE-family HTH domain [Sporosarcina limicola]
MEVCHIETLGERIRKLRKQQQLTLKSLAGNELTKGMLSLIENNKANPSMESLNYIAERLGVEVSELLEEVSTLELREVLEKAEKLYNTDFDLLTDEYEQLITLIEPYAQKLTQGYESARLLEMYSRCLHYEKKEGWQVFSDRAATIYEQMKIIQRRASIGGFRAMVKFTEHNYDESLAILLRERSEIEANNAYIDPMTRLDFDYTEAVLHFAVGDSESAIRIMKSGIEFSKEKQVFYRIDYLYRLAVAHAIMKQDDIEYAYYIKKITQYGDFADDKDALFFAKFAEVHYLNSFKKSFKEAHLLLNLLLEEGDYSKEYESFLNLEKGISLFGLKDFEHALVFLEKVTIADYIHHPFDLSRFYVKDAYQALCQEELGNSVEAIRLIDIAVENISTMPHTSYKDFIMVTHELITK